MGIRSITNKFVLSSVTVLVLAILLVASLSIATIPTTQTAAAQSTNANPDSTTRINVWQFFYYVDDDNNPNTPAARYNSESFSRQECEERRDALIAEGQIIGTEYYPIESIEECKMFKGVTQETEKFCFIFKLSSWSEPGLDCRNTKQECNFVRQNFIDRASSDIEEISDCEQRKHLT
jgi:hypothetical protein